MSEHTKDALRYVRANPSPTTSEHMIAGQKPGYLAEVRDCGNGSAEANARRLVACWNACSGMTDAEVSHGLVPASRHSSVAHQRDQLLADIDVLRGLLAESQANDRTAMGYLSEVRAIVGGSDFPEMVCNVARMSEALSECVDLIETITPLEGSTIRKARAAIAAAKGGTQ